MVRPQALLTARIWDNQKLSIRTKANVYRFSGKRNRGRPKLRFQNVCKRDMKSLNIRTGELEFRVLYTKDCKKGKKNTLRNRRR